VDGDLVRETHRVSEAEGTLVSVYSGSISSGKRADFTATLDAWAGQTDLEDGIIETSGSSHPWPLIREIGKRPAFELATFATLIDAKAFIEDYGAGKALFETLIRNEEMGERSTENLMAEQIQFANLLLLTKTDRVSAEALPLVRKCLEILNPRAAIREVVRGKMDVDLLLDGPGMEPAVMAELASGWTEDAAEPTGYDIRSTVISDPRPLHPERLWNVVRTRLGQGVYRSKGFIWMASRDEQVLLWNQAAGSIELELLAYWRAAVLKDPMGRLLPEEKGELARRLEDSHPVFGDRINELTVIGKEADREAFVRELQGCFCTEAEIRAWQAGESFEDPWPKKLRKVGGAEATGS
jgi:G3E family GTPase